MIEQNTQNIEVGDLVYAEAFKAKYVLSVVAVTDEGVHSRQGLFPWNQSKFTVVKTGFAVTRDIT